MTMRFPCWVTPTDPFDHMWLNDVTSELTRMRSEIIELRTMVFKLNSQLAVKCHCGAPALEDDYLCVKCRNEL